MKKFQTFFQNNRIVPLTFLCVLAVYGISFYQKLADYRYWMQNIQDTLCNS